MTKITIKNTKKSAGASEREKHITERMKGGEGEMNALDQAYLAGVLVSALTFGVFKILLLNIREGIAEEKSAKK